MGRLNFDYAMPVSVSTAPATDSSNRVASMAAVQSVIPAGVVQAWAGPLPPTGWLLCDGSAVSRTTYAKLFAAIGTTYGSGNGTTTFNLPDLRGEFIRGLDNGRGVDSGRTLGSSQIDTIQNITGTFSVRRNASGSETVGAYAGAFAAGGESGTASNVLSTGTSSLPARLVTFDASRDARTSNETRPRNVAMNYIIKFA